MKAWIGVALFVVGGVIGALGMKTRAHNLAQNEMAAYTRTHSEGVKAATEGFHVVQGEAIALREKLAALQGTRKVCATARISALNAS